MTNMVGMVWSILDRDINTRICLDRGFVNTRCLAKHVIKEITKENPSMQNKISLDATISSIRRYEKKIDFKDSLDKARKAAVGVAISTKSNIAIVCLEKDRVVQKLLPEFFSVINYSRNEVLRVAQADESIKIAVDEKNLDKILNLVPKTSIISVTKGLAEINLKTHEISHDTPGVISTITTELFLHNINILEMVTLIPEVIIILKNNDLLPAYEAISKLTSPKTL
ncbi:hypothetical protein ACFL6I_11265 [candidate division KSB1 bacterium]